MKGEKALESKGTAGKSSLTVIDNRDGKQLEVEIKNGVVRSKDFWKLNLRTYDPGYKNTASCKSNITFIDGEKGVLRYRGIPIEELAEKSTFLEVSYLLMYGKLPTKSQFEYYQQRVMRHTYVHEELKRVVGSFRYDAHPMGMFISTVTAMSTFHPEANPALAGQKVYKDLTLRNKQIHRLMGTITTIAAFAYRHRIGRPYVAPSSNNKLSYTENFLYMIDKLGNPNYRPHPKLAKALDVLFILHADHEQNCSASAMRHLTSSGVDVYTSIGGAASALYGPRHGGANEAVLRMLESIGDKKNIPAFIEKVKAKKVRLMGFGHRVYKNYDPRARIVRKIAEEVFEITGREPLIEVATELERIALSDPFFVKRKLYPNVDFYSGLIYKAMGFPTDFFPVLFTIPRTAGWLAHWNEFLDDPENVIVRPRQVYAGPKEQKYVPIEQRDEGSAQIDGKIKSYSTPESRRRTAAGNP
eukprot:CAMPEP_0167758670 /NCGR_PEP_ID=MMETSP0110_2-20121227/10591_1 /TAXON_ID=629695 /ORGANISM="Gymnochlora sp., Strain CCMP2014" /LENGTH=470 /DNA_ID=CAMNT_0007644959 /DNA_START=92 /DNA_END=1504 /DNA_ORIENTATION=-